MGSSVWTIAKHVALCCAFAASSRRPATPGSGGAQARRLRALGTVAERDEQAVLARWYGLAEGEDLPTTSRPATARPAARVESYFSAQIAEPVLQA